MFKKIIILLILGSLISIGVFANENENEFRHHRVALTVGVLGGDLSYEYMFNPNFSVLGQIAYHSFIFADSFSVTARGRVYPGGKSFFLDLGLGYSFGYRFPIEEIIIDLVLGVVTGGLWFLTDEFQNKEYSDGVYEHGLSIQPGMGWNIDIGKHNRLMLPISMGLDVRVARYLAILPYFRIGLTYAF